MSKIINMNESTQFITNDDVLPKNDEAIETENAETTTTAKLSASPKVIQWLEKNLFLISIVTSVVLGVSGGFLLRQFFSFDERTIMYFGFPGSIYLRLIKLFIMPLIAFRYRLVLF
jgi:hypothetical protein